MELPLREGELNEYLDSLVDESQQGKKEPSKYWDENMRFTNGEHWQTKLPSHRIPVTANYTAVTVKRLAAMITDTKPNIEVKSHVPELASLTRDILTPTIRANWDENSYDQKFATGLIPKSIILGSCAAAVTYDNTLGPYGNIGLPIIDPRSLILDPTITRAADVDKAEYSGYQTVMSLSQLRYSFGDRAKEVTPDATVSRFVDRSNASGYHAFESPGHRALFRIQPYQGSASYAVARAHCQHFYVNDPRKVKELPVEIQEHFVSRGLTLEDQAWPGGREIIRAGTNKKILADRPNPYIDRKTPIVMYDWGLQTENPWGSSEVQLIKSLQAVLNKLSSAIVENAIKMNNNIWIGDRDALERKEWDDLNDAPGLLVKVRPGRTLRRESPPALPGSVFQMIQWIIQMMDTLTGLVDVTQGRRPIGLVCADMETECLTKRGWKKCDEVLDTDEIYTFNPETEKGEWSPLLKKTVADWNGDVFVVDSPRMDAVVTPNHGWLVGSTNWEKNQVEERQYHQEHSRTANNWVLGAKYQRVEMQDINGSHYIPADFPLEEDKPAVYPDDFVRLVGWVVTDGHYEYHKRTIDPIRRDNSYSVGITQSLKANPEKCKEIERILQSLRIPYSTKYGNNDVIVYRFRKRWAKEFQAQFPDKRPGYPFLSTLTPAQLLILRDTMIDGDGNIGANGHLSYSSSDRELLDQFQMIVALCGSTSTTRDTGIERERHRRECYGPHLSLSINSRERIQWRPILENHQITKKPYSGQVWCPTTTTGTWLARRNGKVYLTHNSSNAIEALTLAAQTLIRYQARKFENFLERVGKRMIARIFQFYTANRMMYTLGPNGAWQEFGFKREQILNHMVDDQPFNIFRDLDLLSFLVTPGSSMAITRVQKAQLSMGLYQGGLIPGYQVLQSVEWDNPRETVNEARTEKMMGMQNIGEQPTKRARVAA